MLLYKTMHEIIFYVQCNMMILKLLSVGKLAFSGMLVVEHIITAACM